MSIKKAAHLTIRTIAEIHQQLSLPKPVHPLITLISPHETKDVVLPGAVKMTTNLYVICLETDFKGKVRYGEGYYDFSAGVMFFTAPGQVTEMDEGESVSGQWLIIDPQLFLGHSLATTIQDHRYFSYSVNETLFLSDKEKQQVERLMNDIAEEYKTNSDRSSRDILIAQVELLLNYCNRFYQRQFAIPRKSDDQLLAKMDNFLTAHFDGTGNTPSALPSVQSLADALNLTPNYLSDILRAITGESAQQHIHNKLLGKAKELLVSTRMSAREIAFQLGFEHSQSFSKLFKNKINLSPLEFRKRSQRKI